MMMSLGNGCPSGQYMDENGNCVGIAYCVTGYHFDTTLNKCVLNRADDTTKSSLLSANMLYILIGAVVLLLFMGKKQ
jgi:hypothetical protein